MAFDVHRIRWQSLARARRGPSELTARTCQESMSRFMIISVAEGLVSTLVLPQEVGSVRWCG